MTPIEWWIAGLGLCVGVLLDRCVRRLSYEKSLVYPPRRHCPRCLRPLSAMAAVPLLGRFLAGGRCGGCGLALPWRPMLLQLLTAAAFVALYRGHVLGRGDLLPYEAHMQNNFGAERLRALAIYHGILFCFLLVACVIDWDLTLIPLPVTLVGSAAGIALGTFWYVELHPLPLWFAHASQVPRAAQWCDHDVWQRVFRWWTGERAAALPTGWESLRAWAFPHWDLNWNRYLGFATGAAGWLAGYACVWAMDETCSRTLGRKALGDGDRDLLAMIGAYLGWQSAVLAFTLSWVAAVALALPVLLLRRRGGHFPFGPYLGIGAALCVGFWRPLFRELRDLFMTFGVFLGVAMAGLVALALTTAAVRALKGLATARSVPA